MKTEDLFCKLLRRVESIGAVVRALFTCLKPRATCDSSGMFCPCCWGYLWWGALACFPRCCALSLKSTSWPNLFLLWRTLKNRVEGYDGKPQEMSSAWCATWAKPENCYPQLRKDMQGILWACRNSRNLALSFCQCQSSAWTAGLRISCLPEVSSRAQWLWPGLKRRYTGPMDPMTALEGSGTVWNP